MSLAVLPGAPAHAQVLRTVEVEAQDLAGYLKEVERGKALFKKVGSPAQIRVWRAKYAGEAAGRITVTVEYPDLATLAADEKKFQTDPELKTWLEGLDRYRRVLSDSLHYELGR